MYLFSTRTGKKEKDNRGFSLVELVIVMAIMGLLVGTATFGISLMYSRDTQSVANSIDDELTQLRMISMTKAGDYKITINTTGNVSKNNTITLSDGEVKKLDKNVKITMEKVNGSGSWSENGAANIDIKFDASNGSVSVFGGDTDVSGIYVIKIESGSGATARESKVNLVQLTGRHFVE